MTGVIGETVGNHVIVAALDAGGMGTVHRAIQPAIGARVAITVMWSAPDDVEGVAAG